MPFFDNYIFKLLCQKCTFAQNFHLAVEMNPINSGGGKNAAFPSPQ